MLWSADSCKGRNTLSYGVKHPDLKMLATGSFVLKWNVAKETPSAARPVT